MIIIVITNVTDNCGNKIGVKISRISLEKRNENKGWIH